ERASLAVQADAPGFAVEIPLGPDAMFPDEAGVGKIERGNLRVWSLLIVVVEILAAAAGDALRRVEPEDCAGDVEAVNAVVAQLARAVVPKPMPVVMEAVRIERPLGCRAKPEIVIDAIGYGAVRFFADGFAVAADPTPGERHLAELAGADELRRTGH